MSASEIFTGLFVGIPIWGWLAITAAAIAVGMAWPINKKPPP